MSNPDSDRKKRKIHTALMPLNTLGSTEVILKDPGRNDIYIKSPFEFVPDFHFEWCQVKNHYRVYIHVASLKYNKKDRVGYSIMAIGSSLAGAAFTTFYSFLYNHRANVKA